MVKKFWNWLIYSSINPQKISLTIKGVGAFLATYVVFASNIFGLEGLTPDSWQSFVSTVIEIVNWIAYIVTGIIALWGAARKGVRTIKSWSA